MYVLYWVKELSGLMFSLHQAQFLVLFWLAHINKTPIIYSPKKAAFRAVVSSPNCRDAFHSRFYANIGNAILKTTPKIGFVFQNLRFVRCNLNIKIICFL